MSFPKCLWLFAAVCGSASLFADRGHAADSSDNTATNQSGFHAYVVSQPVPNLAPVPCGVASFGTNQYSFLVPDGFRMNGSSAEQVVLVNADFDCFITLSLASPAPSNAKPDFCRDLLLSQYPGAKILEEFSASAGNHTGPAFNLHWTTARGVAQSGRFAFIPMAAGVLEFSVTTKSDKFPGVQSPFNLFLLTFRTNEGGKLEFVKISDRI